MAQHIFNKTTHCYDFDLSSQQNNQRLQSAEPSINDLLTGALITFKDMKQMDVLMEVTNSIALI